MEITITRRTHKGKLLWRIESSAGVMFYETVEGVQTYLESLLPFLDVCFQNKL